MTDSFSSLQEYNNLTENSYVNVLSFRVLFVFVKTRLGFFCDR